MQILTSPLSERSIHCTQPSGMDVASDLSCLDFDKRKGVKHFARLCWLVVIHCSVVDHHQPAQPGKVAGTLYPCCWWHYFFQSMTAALMKNACWPLSAQGLDCVHRSRTTFVLEDTSVTAPMLAAVGSREWAMATAHHVPSSRIFKKQTRTLKSFQGSFMRFVVKSSDTFCVNFLQDVLRRKALEPGLVCKQP